MKDREFLTWLHNRLRFEHDEHPGRDYMQKLRAIIHATPVDRETPNTATPPESLSWQSHSPVAR